MEKKLFTDTKRLTGIAICVALVVALQVIATFVKFGPFPITLTLVPIVIGAIMFGAAAGALLGAACGVVVLIMCATGADPGGNVLWAANPLLTAFLCVLKSSLAGWASGFVYKALETKLKYLNVIVAAAVCPTVNTGIFLAALIFLYRDVLVNWAGETDIIYFAFVAVAGANYLIELILNVALSPGIARVIKISKNIFERRAG